MAALQHTGSLPVVEEDDLLNLVFDDIADPSHIERWKRFAVSNEVLAREVLKRAVIIATNQRTSHPESGELQKSIIDTITFTMAALEVAMQRTKEESTPNL